MIDLTFDIETIPDVREGAFDLILADTIANFKAPSTLTKEQAAADLGMTEKDEIKYTSKDAMIKLWEKEMAATKAFDVADAAYRKTALDGAKGSICCIGFKIGDFSPETITAPTERETLKMFFDELYSLRVGKIIGHNVHSFDLRFLYQRAVILGVAPTFHLNHGRYSEFIFDTMTQWAGYDGRISLDNLCHALNVPTPKTDLDGSKVLDYYKAGRISEIAEYCAKDVAATYACYQKMTFQADSSRA